MKFLKRKKKKKLSMRKAFTPGFSSVLTIPKLLCIHAKTPRAPEQGEQSDFTLCLRALIQVISTLLLLHPHPSRSLPPAQAGMCSSTSLICQFPFSISCLPAFPNCYPGFLCLTRCKNNPDCKAQLMFTGACGNFQLTVINFQSNFKLH